MLYLKNIFDNLRNGLGVPNLYKEVDVKKTLFLTTLLLILAGIAPIMAQENAPPAVEGTYAVTVSVERVYPYRKGYIVKYKKGITQIVDAYLPYEWFQGKGDVAKGELVLIGSGRDWPHMTIFYKDGVFDHVRLYVRKERSHESWGNVPATVNIDDRFEGVEDIRLEF
jgi:hypothetical protein